MDNEQLLQAMSDMMDQKLAPINSRLDKIDNRLDVLELKQDKATSKIEEALLKMDGIQLDIKISERNIRKDIKQLQDADETVEQVLKLHDLIPG